MSRNAEHQFVTTDTAEIKAYVVAMYESLTGTTLKSADPMMLVSRWLASLFIQERALLNYTGNQNIPSRAVGDNLDALGELFYLMERPDATPATCTVRFYISEAQTRPVLIPAGTRCTDRNQTVYWATGEDNYIPEGSISIDLSVICQTAGITGNGYLPGQINTIVDVYDYYDRCENTTESANGSDRLTDDEFYQRMRDSQGAYSTAGPIAGYEYWAKSVSTEIVDVVVNSPSPGVVSLYALMSDGTIAGEETKAAILDACRKDDRRPLTDYVQTGDPEEVPCEIEFAYYLLRGSVVSASDIAAMVKTAVEEYISWQTGKLGRDINPSYLHNLLMNVGVKRVEIKKPVFTQLEDGRSISTTGSASSGDKAPQVAKIARESVIIIDGGYEDE